MILATSALKWQRMSFSVSESLSFSASSNCLVRSTYSSSVLLREWLSPSNPPLALYKEEIITIGMYTHKLRETVITFSNHTAQSCA